MTDEMSTVSTRLEPDGIVVLIQTRWSDDDLIGRLRDDRRERPRDTLERFADENTAAIGITSKVYCSVRRPDGRLRVIGPGVRPYSVPQCRQLRGAQAAQRPIADTLSSVSDGLLRSAAVVLRAISDLLAEIADALYTQQKQTPVVIDQLSWAAPTPSPRFASPQINTTFADVVILPQYANALIEPQFADVTMRPRWTEEE